MILLNFFIGFFAIFISPHIFLYYRFPNIKYSLVVIYSFIVSFTAIWILTLLSYYLNLPNLLIYLLAIFIAISSLVYMYIHHNTLYERKYNLIIWGLGIILLIPLFQYVGTGFTEWDAVVSWNKWGLELYRNEYIPIHAAYPVLMPSLYSIIYKIQGTSDIWWTAKIALSTLPLAALILPVILYKDYKNKAFIFMAILIYPYLLMRVTIEGAVDMPVMIMGMLTLTTLYAAEINKGKDNFEYYVYASVLLAGLASITKQSGLAFILFVYIYILLNLKYFNNKKRLLLITILSSLYFITFLSIYYLNSFTSATGNIELLQSLSAHTFANKELLWNKFFSYPPNIPILEPIANVFKIPSIIPYLMGLGFIIFILKDTKKYNSMAVLSVIFLIIGFFAWGKYASYHPRNSYWIHVFLIMIVSINFNHFIVWYQKKQISPVLIYSLIILLPIIYFTTLSNDFANKKQQSFQKKLGWEGMAKDIVEIVQSKDKCLNIYTNDFMLLYNYHTRGIQDHIISEEVSEEFLRKSIEHTCKDGSYISFRSSTRHYPIWKKHITRLISDQKIISHEGSGYLFYIPPYTTLSNDYFEDKTIMSKVKILDYDDKIHHSIESIDNNNKSYLIKGWGFLKDAQVDSTEKYIVLRKDDKEFIVVTNVILRPDVTEHFKAKDLIRSGFKSYIYKKDFDKGEYDINILLIDKNQKQHFIQTDKKIIIDYDINKKGSLE